MQKVFNITNKYIILTTVLILYSLISNIYAVSFAIGNRVNIIGLVFAVILLTFMTAAFLSGWLKMVCSAIENKDADNTNSLIKIFPEGVGEYILSVLGSFIVMGLFIVIISFATFYAGNHFIGDPQIDITKFAKIGNNMAEVKTFLATLSPEQINKFAKWNQLILCSIVFSYFALFLYLPAIFYKNKNPFIAFFISIKNLLSRKLLKTLGVFILIFIANTTISVLTALFSSNAIISFIVTLTSFYILTASTVGLFSFYNNNFTDSQFGQNIDVHI